MLGLLIQNLSLVDKISTSNASCGIPYDFNEILFCTSWMNNVKCDNKSTRCVTYRNYATKCFDFYNGVSTTPTIESSNSSDDKALVSFISIFRKHLTGTAFYRS